MKLNKKTLITAISLLLIGTMLFSLSSCAVEVKAANLMEGVTAKTVTGKPADEKFIDSTANFYVELFKKTITKDKNSLISPLSVMLALSMTANGADNETLAQMEEVLGDDISIDELNEYLYSYVKGLPSDSKSKLNISNSIWFRDDESRLTVEPEFLQTNADYYGADAFKSAFDDQTLQDINNWVKQKTDGTIDKILEEINPDAVMYLLNAIIFDAEWDTVYTKDQIYKGEFTAFDGSKKQVDMMRSEESKYIKDENVTGFIKPYANGNYSFVALLPGENISIDEYIGSMTGEKLLALIKNAEQTGVSAAMPKFSYDYTIKMNDALIALGMPDAFSSEKADLTRLGKSSRGNLFIYEVLHKTYISVDELGTKAGAVTKVEIWDKAAVVQNTVILNRPFVYAIIDNSTNLPVFIGTVLDIK